MSLPSMATEEEDEILKERDERGESTPTRNTSTDELMEASFEFLPCQRKKDVADEK